MKKRILNISALATMLLLVSQNTYAQQGFGTNKPSKASVIEMKSDSKGLLIPRVALTALDSFDPIRGETATDVDKTNGLTVFNTATTTTGTNDVYPGYYYWDTTLSQWVRLLNQNDLPASVNIYNADGTLTGPRKVEGTENWLMFEGTTGNIHINGNNLRSISNTGGITDLYYNGNTARLSTHGNSDALDIGTHDTDNATPIIFRTSEGGGHLSNERMRIAGTGEVGIGTDNPTELLDVADGNVRVRNINTVTGSDTDKMVVADADGVLKTVNQAPRFFYMPAVIFDTRNVGTGLTRNLYDDYKNQFTGVAFDVAHGANASGNNFSSMPYTGGLVASSGAPAQIHVFEDDELYYYITYYDQDVIQITGINDTGELTYNIIDNSAPSSYMNIVFVIKDN